jgi:D-hydroxyproline dehydrogenase subunit beta
MPFRVVVIGAGIVGLACAWAAHAQGASVLVIDKDDHCVGASIRNFGFVTVTGQGSGKTWQRAKQSREIWADLAPRAGIQVVQQGLLVLAQRDQAALLLRQLISKPEGDGLEWLDANALIQKFPQFEKSKLLGAIYSPHELRVEPRLAIGQLKSWLEGQGVKFQMGQSASLLPDGRLFVGNNLINYDHLLAAPGANLRAFAPNWTVQNRVTTCRLSMLRVRPPEGYVLPHPVMSDLSLVRYRGYTELPESKALRIRLELEQVEHLNQGIHLIIVQSADGSLVVGDSHHYGHTVDPFAQSATEALILQEMQAILRLPYYQVTERWVGFYPSGPDDAVITRLRDQVSLVSVTSGTGMSTGFALGLEWAKGVL